MFSTDIFMYIYSVSNGYGFKFLKGYDSVTKFGYCLFEGSAQYPKEGTTNLHLDVSDACNVMVYVGYLKDEHRGRVEKDEVALKAIDMAGCDSITKRRVQEVREVAGALWHIFDACDADKIRDFLNKVCIEILYHTIQTFDIPVNDVQTYCENLTICSNSLTNSVKGSCLVWRHISSNTSVGT